MSKVILTLLSAHETVLIIETMAVLRIEFTWTRVSKINSLKVFQMPIFTLCGIDSSTPRAAFASGNRVIIGSENGLYLFGAKPLSKPMIGYCEPITANSSEILIKIQTFTFTKIHLKCRPRNDGHFVYGYTSAFQGHKICRWTCSTTPLCGKQAVRQLYHTECTQCRNQNEGQPHTGFGHFRIWKKYGTCLPNIISDVDYERLKFLMKQMAGPNHDSAEGHFIRYTFCAFMFFRNHLFITLTALYIILQFIWRMLALWQMLFVVHATLK